MVRALQAMYDNVKAWVKYKNKCFQIFNINSGVKQGDPLSPVLFIFFINDILENISAYNGDALSFIDLNLSILILLYADDAVLFSTSPEMLQNMMLLWLQLYLESIG